MIDSSRPGNQPTQQPLQQNRRAARVRLAWACIAAVLLLPIVHRQTAVPQLQPATALVVSLLVLATATRFWDGLIEQIQAALSDITGFATAIATLTPYVAVLSAIAVLAPGSSGGSLIWGTVAAAACWCQRALSKNSDGSSSRSDMASNGRHDTLVTVSDLTDLADQSTGPAECSSAKSIALSGMDAFQPEWNESMEPLESDLEMDLEAEPLDESSGCLHRYVRGQSSELGDYVEGRLRVELAAGQTHRTAHVTFCPPFGEPPEVSCESLVDPAVRIKVAAVFRHGVRLEIRRSHADFQATVELGYAAFAGNAQQRAA